MATIVYICGIDGSGKTTLTSRISRELKRRGYNSKVVYLGGLHAFGYLMYPLTKIAKLLDLNRNEVGFRRFSGFVWPWAYVMSYSLYFLVKTRGLTWLKKSGYILFDRYSLDGVVELAVENSIEDPMESLPLRILLSFPSPKFKIYLDIEEEVAFERKKEEKHSLMWLRERRSYYQALCHKLDYFKLSGMDDPQILVEKTIDMILTLPSHADTV